MADPVPFLMVRVSTTKNHKSARIELHSDVVTALRALIPMDAPGNRAVFRRLPTVAELKMDEVTAGIPFLDDLGRRADFHAFRHTFTTLLAPAGVPPQIAKELTRHSDLRMNGHYTDATKLPLANVIRALPSAVPKNHSRIRTQESGAEGHFVTFGVTSGPSDCNGGAGEENLVSVGKTPENGPAPKAVLPSGPLVAGLGFEPRTFRL